MANKTVYILGAGASRTANLPIQSELLPLVFSIRLNGENDNTAEGGFLSLNLDDKAERIREIYPIFDSFRKVLGEFLVVNFLPIDKINEYRLAIKYADSLREIDIDQREEYLFKAYDIVKSINVTLEDLFTIFDNIAIGREHFRLYSPERMGIIHNRLKLCIIYSLVYSLATQCDDSQYRRFSELLMRTRLAASQKEDILSVITMNWDNVLEQTLYEKCIEYNSAITKNQQKVYPDLCFYNYSLMNNPEHLPSTHIKAKGHKNIKILKMHGSLAWLECPKCGRIYSDFVRGIAADEYSEIRCPNCISSISFIADDPVLRSLIVTPTFMKSFSNLNLKNIWYNAYIDVSEADHIIFIGYSFPDADFEMRCLLKKAVSNNAQITVVLHNSDDPKKYILDLLEKGFSEEKAKQLTSKMRLPEERYKSFFGDNKVSFCYQGLQGYLDKIGGDIDGKKENE